MIEPHPNLFASFFFVFARIKLLKLSLILHNFSLVVSIVVRILTHMMPLEITQKFAYQLFVSETFDFSGIIFLEKIASLGTLNSLTQHFKKL